MGGSSSTDNTTEFVNNLMNKLYSENDTQNLTRNEQTIRDSLDETYDKSLKVVNKATTIMETNLDIVAQNIAKQTNNIQGGKWVLNGTSMEINQSNQLMQTAVINALYEVSTMSSNIGDMTCMVADMLDVENLSNLNNGVDNKNKNQNEGKLDAESKVDNESTKKTDSDGLATVCNAFANIGKDVDSSSKTNVTNNITNDITMINKTLNQVDNIFEQETKRNYLTKLTQNTENIQESINKVKMSLQAMNNAVQDNNFNVDEIVATNAKIKIAQGNTLSQEAEEIYRNTAEAVQQEWQSFLDSKSTDSSTKTGVTSENKNTNSTTNKNDSSMDASNSVSNKNTESVTSSLFGEGGLLGTLLGTSEGSRKTLIIVVIVVIVVVVGFFVIKFGLLKGGGKGSSSDLRKANNENNKLSKELDNNEKLLNEKDEEIAKLNQRIEEVGEKDKQIQRLEKELEKYKKKNGDKDTITADEKTYIMLQNANNKLERFQYDVKKFADEIYNLKDVSTINKKIDNFKKRYQNVWSETSSNTQQVQNKNNETEEQEASDQNLNSDEQTQGFAGGNCYRPSFFNSSPKYRSSHGYL